jgi:hypothetical protein
MILFAPPDRDTRKNFKQQLMGLAISYSFNLKGASNSQAREKILALHRSASALPFLKVGELIELEGADCLFQDPDPHLALKVCALTPEELVHNLLNRTAETGCCHLIGFSGLPGQGCAEVAFGLAARHTPAGGKDWTWRASCKTQYANNPDYGGMENFLKCHLLMIEMLEAAGRLGMLAAVTDPSGYWEDRDPEALVKTVSEGTLMMAAIMGSLKDAFGQKGYSAIAPIFESPNFEYLEAAGNDIKFSPPDD